METAPSFTSPKTNTKRWKVTAVATTLILAGCTTEQTLLDTDNRGIAVLKAVELEVENQGGPVLNGVVRTPWPHPVTAKLTAYELDEKGYRKGRTLASIVKDLDGDHWLVWRLPGVSDAGSTRRFSIAVLDDESTKPPAEGEGHTDLSAARVDDRIEIDNMWFGWTIPTSGHGALPTEVRFNHDGRREPESSGLRWLDRLKRENADVPTLLSGQAASARIVHHDALVTVVETESAYQDDGAGGEKTAVSYRYEIHAGSPVVLVTARVEHDRPDSSHDVVFCHLARGNNHTPRYLGGEPPVRAEFAGAGEQRSPVGWAVMLDELEAIGIGASSVVVHPATTGDHALSVNLRDADDTPSRYAARLFFGPGGLPEDEYRDWLRADRWRIGVVESQRDAPFGHGANDAPLVLENGAVRFGFDSKENGLGLRSLYNVCAGLEHLQPARDGELMWQLELRDEVDHAVLVNNKSLSQRHVRRQRRSDGGQSLVLTWKNVSLPEEADALDVTVTIDLPRGVLSSELPAGRIPRWGDPEVVDSGMAQWRIDVENRSNRFGQWTVTFPIMAGPGARARIGQFSAGRGREDWMRRSETADYPHGHRWPVQFLSFYEASHGVYLGMHDPGARAKRFRFDPSRSFMLTIDAEDMGVAGSDYRMAWPIVLGVYEGDWMTAAKRYRRWATQEVPWCAKGPIHQRADYSQQLKEVGIWWREFNDIDNIKRVGDLTRCGLAVHWYGWHQIPFDRRYPEYFPVTQTFIDRLPL